ncbi:hypothetical protein [Pseudomarimonas arenosa]|uniref:Uncharacterized protein n=1 Tax=Pseudomarimonas arenosa TaxID=2774145 RepID=A0AAW3ZV01_9GAMM|nr:hypothetical protein [Pseudomarimonas arenosa]MBD8528269.1 hypothetical protein [Pseudomarimonas arenosa]
MQISHLGFVAFAAVIVSAWLAGWQFGLNKQLVLGTAAIAMFVVASHTKTLVKG